MSTRNIQRNPAGLTPDRHAYQKRVREVLYGDAPACPEHGRDHARCILPPAHPGNLHEGPGYDEWGPKYVCWFQPRPWETTR